MPQIDHAPRWSLAQLCKHLITMAKDAQDRRKMEQLASDWRRRAKEFVQTLPPDEVKR